MEHYFLFIYIAGLAAIFIVTTYLLLNYDRTKLQERNRLIVFGVLPGPYVALHELLDRQNMMEICGAFLIALIFGAALALGVRNQTNSRLAGATFRTKKNKIETKSFFMLSLAVVMVPVLVYFAELGEDSFWLLAGLSFACLITAIDNFLFVKKKEKQLGSDIVISNGSGI